MKRTLTTAIWMLLLLPASGQESCRVVSLAPSITKNLYLLGAGDCLVGCTRYCVTAPGETIAIVADAVNVNMERVALLRPTVVLASGLTHPRIVSGLERLGLKVTRLDQPRDFDEICSQLEILGDITGKQDVAVRVNRESRARVQVIEQQVSARRAPPPRVFFQIGDDPLFTALPGTFMHDYIVRAGGENIAGQLSEGIVSREFVLLAVPDVILVTAMGTTGDEQVKRWQEIPSLPAVRSGRVYPVDDSICSPTPAAFAEAVEAIARLIHPAP